MQKIEIPEILNDIRHKITVLEERLELIQNGLQLYTDLADKETDPLQQFQYKELAAKKREELIVYSQQIRSQKVYLTEFEKDLKQQQGLRKKQLADVKTHQPTMLKKAKELLKNSTKLTEQDRTILIALREKFIKDTFENEADKIMKFRELVSILKSNAL